MTAGAGVITGNGTASVTIAGTAAQINAALAGLAYTGNLDFNGGDTLTVATSDGTATDTDMIAITVNPVNDAPALNLDADSSTTGGVDYLTAFIDGGPAVAIVDTDVSVIDSDSPNLVSATITLTNPHAGDSLTVRRHLLFRAASRERLRFRHRGPHAHGRRIAADYQAALQQIRFATPAPILRPKPASSTWSSTMERSQATWRTRSSRSWRSTTVHPPSISTATTTTLPGTSYRTTFTENGPPVAIADTDTLIGDPDIGSTIRFSHHHADEPADRRSADRGPAAASHHRFRYEQRPRGPHALRHRSVCRLRDCAGGDPLQRGWRQSGCGNPHHSSRRQ